MLQQGHRRVAEWERLKVGYRKAIIPVRRYAIAKIDSRRMSVIAIIFNGDPLRMLLQLFLDVGELLLDS
jgi:hypothetical protein